MNPLYFYSVRDPYGEFSNFSPHPFEKDGIYYRTSEHYFQAQKFANSQKDFDAVINCKSPGECAKVGRDRSRPLRKDWEDVKDDVMREALRLKFEKHPQLKDLLMQTGDRDIIENTTYDYYWGNGTNGTGKNMLGILLVELRESLRDE